MVIEMASGCITRECICQGNNINRPVCACLCVHVMNEIFHAFILPFPFVASVLFIVKNN